MSSTLFAAVSLLARFHRFLLRPASVGAVPERQAQAFQPVRAGHVPPGGAERTVNSARTCPTPESRRRTAPPLRVLQVLEVGQPAAHGGRMVISGRMADVCAELDRMVAREAALHASP